MKSVKLGIYLTYHCHDTSKICLKIILFLYFINIVVHFLETNFWATSRNIYTKKGNIIVKKQIHIVTFYVHFFVLITFFL